MNRCTMPATLRVRLLPLWGLIVLACILICAIGVSARSQKRRGRTRASQPHVAQARRTTKKTKPNDSAKFEFDETLAQAQEDEAERDDALARQNWFMFQRTYPNVTIPDEARHIAWE